MEVSNAFKLIFEVVCVYTHTPLHFAVCSIFLLLFLLVLFSPGRGGFMLEDRREREKKSLVSGRRRRRDEIEGND